MCLYWNKNRKCLGNSEKDIFDTLHAIHPPNNIMFFFHHCTLLLCVLYYWQIFRISHTNKCFLHVVIYSLMLY